MQELLTEAWKREIQGATNLPELLAAAERVAQGMSTAHTEKMFDSQQDILEIRQMVLDHPSNSEHVGSDIFKDLLSEVGKTDNINICG